MNNAPNAQVTPPRRVVTFLRSLKPCERRVLDKCLTTDRVKTIADELDLSENTVEAYRKRVFKKWRVLHPKCEQGKVGFHKMIMVLILWQVTLPEQKSIGKLLKNTLKNA